MNKKGQGFMNFVFFFLILFTILVIGIIGVIAVSLFNFTSDTITPVMEGIGVVGSANVSEASQYTFGTVDKVVNSFPWLLAFGYVAMLIFSMIFVISYNYNPNPIFIGIYFVLVILLIFGSILMSNVYESIYSSGDAVISAGMEDQQAMNFMMLHSPWILTLIAFIVGIYIFAGRQGEGGGGGFNI